ncbi:SGNH/GDSL hydrolase family protein [Streptomyces sp. ODS28]|uniref:SGNH/GDSL hydrolase family protein n=1 Tax=Streptomyces sp. ODS28 TaxID=3136688 RepID=UPI0031EE4722
MSLRTRAGGLVAAVTASTLAALGLAAPAQAQAYEGASGTPLRYAALGDSYSAASGNFPLARGASPLCAQSVKNYPHLLAQRTGARLTDVTCGAAQTKDFTRPQYPGVPAQLDAVGERTRLVTMTIGGNDNNTFIGAILSCTAAGIASHGRGSPCKDKYGDSFEERIDESTLPALVKALAATHEKAPNARVAILGYPWILPPKADPSCGPKMPVAEGDVPYLRSLQTHLNAAVEKAAARTGTTYVDMAGVSEGHDACKPAGTRWIEPAFFSTSLALVHPNPRGERGMADQTARTLGLG